MSSYHLSRFTPRWSRLGVETMLWTSDVVKDP
jgi:hypothetical protein